MNKETSSKNITFEQPLNEQLRICLRLEQLQTQLNECLSNSSNRGSQMSLLTLLRIIDVIDPPHIKPRLIQTLSQFATNLGQLEQFPQVDTARLHDLLKQLDTLLQRVHQMPARFGESLRSNEFLSQLRPQLAHPGGIFLHHSPAFALWLSQSQEVRSKELTQWANELQPLPEITGLILQLTRSSTSPQQVTTSHGFYHQVLDQTFPCHMIQVIISAELGVYAEISAGKHRLSIRFLKPNYLSGERPKQIVEPITFLLNCCRF